MDISHEAVEIGRRGRYTVKDAELIDTNILERMTSAEIEEIFDRDGDEVTVKSWIREGIEWHVGDVGEVGIGDVLGPQESWWRATSCVIWMRCRRRHACATLPAW